MYDKLKEAVKQFNDILSKMSPEEVTFYRLKTEKDIGKTRSGMLYLMPEVQKPKKDHLL